MRDDDVASGMMGIDVVRAKATGPPFGLLALAGCTESWEIRLPTWNEFTPLSVIDMETALFVLSELTRSAMRPPQPVLNGWSGMLLCHWACWSLCEKSCGGTLTLWALYWATVVGSTRVPTLARIASFPPSKRFFSSPVDGCRAKERPSEVLGRIGSRVDCGRARAVRALAYAA